MKKQVKVRIRSKDGVKEFLINKEELDRILNN
jgi:hypothetical protein